MNFSYKILPGSNIQDKMEAPSEVSVHNTQEEKHSSAEQQESGYAIISFNGSLIEKNQTLSLIEEIEDLIIQNKNKFILDLAELKYINSSGLNILVRILTKSRKSGGETIVANVSDKIKELFITTKLHTVFTITESTEEAVRIINEKEVMGS